jgi:hypothetical protein
VALLRGQEKRRLASEVSLVHVCANLHQKRHAGCVPVQSRQIQWCHAVLINGIENFAFSSEFSQSGETSRRGRSTTIRAQNVKAGHGAFTARWSFEAELLWATNRRGFRRSTPYANDVYFAFTQFGYELGIVQTHTTIEQRYDVVAPAPVVQAFNHMLNGAAIVELCLPKTTIKMVHQRLAYIQHSNLDKSSLVKTRIISGFPLRWVNHLAVPFLQLHFSGHQPVL